VTAADEVESRGPRYGRRSEGRAGAAEEVEGQGRSSNRRGGSSPGSRCRRGEDLPRVEDQGGLLTSRAPPTPTPIRRLRRILSRSLSTRPNDEADEIVEPETMLEEPTNPFGEGSFVGTEPPEGFTIKGNDPFDESTTCRSRAGTSGRSPMCGSTAKRPLRRPGFTRAQR